MLGYRHAFHAGNHADVLKHVVLVQLLRHLAQKEKAFWVIDTHAGAGLYALNCREASRLGEYQSGIGRLWEAADLPPAVGDYVACVRTFNPDGRLRLYPGSPALAQMLTRPQDRLRLFELHPTEHALLEEGFRGDRRLRIEVGDGFTGLVAHLPPPSRRGLVLIDPSYELRTDYARVVEAVKEGLRRFATGIYAIWHPLLARLEAERLPKRLRAAAGNRPWLAATLTVQAANPAGLGLYGSGMFVINPPWTLTATLRDALRHLAQRLAQDDSAEWRLEEST